MLAVYVYRLRFVIVFLFFFNYTATTEIYTLSLHDALPIWIIDTPQLQVDADDAGVSLQEMHRIYAKKDRKSTRLNSSHLVISYAVFCLKKKKTFKVFTQGGKLTYWKGSTN